MTGHGYKPTRWGDPSHVRLHRRKPTITLVAVTHNGFVLGNVSFAIWKQTFAESNMNDRVGSIPADGAQAGRMTGIGQNQTLAMAPPNV